MRRLSRRDLAGKTIDVHTHAGVNLKAYANLEYPFAQTIEGLAAEQRAAGVDVSVVFPFTADLYFEWRDLLAGNLVPAKRRVSPAPYAIENRRVAVDLYRHCPELVGRFLPFVSVDPGRAAKAQVRELIRLADEFPLYGVKVNPVLCQSRIAGLLGRGAPLLDFAEERDLPVLIHATTWPGDAYSQAADAFRVVERRPQLRFCFAHALLFHRASLEWADAQPNVWVDTAAMKIQVELVERDGGRTVPRSEWIEADYRDHRRVMRALAERFPATLLWGSDSPAYAYICRRKQAVGRFQDFTLKGTFADEVAALEALPPRLRRRVSSENTLDFLFGGGKGV